MTQTEDKKFPSKLIGGVHKTLLAVMLAVFSLVAVCTVIFASSIETYMSYFATIDQALSSFGGILYIIVTVNFFIWIISVHRAIKQQYPDYPIAWVGAIVRMLPLISLYGLGSTFSNIGSYFYRKKDLNRKAKIIHNMIIPLYIVVFVGNGIDRFILRNPAETSNVWVLIGALMDVAAITVYLIMTRTIHSGLRELYALAEQDAVEAADNVTALQSEAETGAATV
jgi:riboflavin transporter FmnP